jgi:hypothetical protein
MSASLIERFFHFARRAWTASRSISSSSGPCCDVFCCGAHVTEAARVDVDHARPSATSLDREPHALESERLVVARELEPAGHAEVREDSSPPLERDAQPLAAALDRPNGAAHDRPLERRRTQRPDDARIMYFARIDPAVADPPRETLSYVLDVGQLRHAASIPWSPGLPVSSIFLPAVCH